MLYNILKEKDEFMTLQDENGRKAEFEFLEMTVLNDCEYAAVVENNTDEVVVLRYEQRAGGEEIFESIDDDLLFERVCKKFAEEFGDIFFF